MDGLNLGLGADALGGKVSLNFKAIPPGGWVGLALLVGAGVLAWHHWDSDDADSSDWGDPQQPPTNADMAMAPIPFGPITPPAGEAAMRSRKWGVDRG